MSGRKVVHIDMEAFYAPVEQRDNTELRGKRFRPETVANRQWETSIDLNSLRGFVGMEQKDSVKDFWSSFQVLSDLFR